MALGTKEDRQTIVVLYSQAIIQSKLGVREFASLDKIYYSIDFVDYSILSITIICRIIDKKMKFYTYGVV